MIGDYKQIAKRRYTKRQVLDAIEECDGFVFHAARKLGCTEDTIANYRLYYPEVDVLVKHKRGEMIDEAERQLGAAIKRGEPWAVCFFLKCQAKNRGYVERQVVNHDGGQTLKIVEEIIVNRDEAVHRKNGVAAPCTNGVPLQ